MTSASGCTVCGLKYPLVVMVPCGLCGKPTHSGPDIYCAAVRYELEEGVAVFGPVRASLGTPEHATFPRWHTEAARKATCGGQRMVCADCLLSDL